MMTSWILGTVFYFFATVKPTGTWKAGFRGRQIFLSTKQELIRLNVLLKFFERTASRTAEIVSEQAALTVEIEAALTERHFGPLEGLVVNDVKKEIGVPPSVPMAAYLPPEAEQWPHTVARTQSAIGKWLNLYPNERILFVAHHGLFAALTEILIGARH